MIPELEPFCNSWIVTITNETKQQYFEFFDRSNIERIASLCYPNIVIKTAYRHLADLNQSMNNVARERY